MILMKNDLRIRTGNAAWWFIVLCTVLLFVVFNIVSSSMDMDGRRHFLLCLSFFELLYLLAYKHSLRNIRPDFNYWNELPCYLCNLSTLMCIFAAAVPSSAAYAYCSTVGFLCALLAFLMPDGPNRNQKFFSLQTLGFYGYHGLLACTSMCFFSFGLYVPQYSDIPAVVLACLMLLIIAHLTNAVLRRTGLNPVSNYIFTYTPDNFILQKFYDRFPVRFWYLVPCAVPLAVLCLMMTALLKLLSAIL